MTNGLADFDWDVIEQSLTKRGFAHLPRLLAPDQCAGMIDLYDQADLFRSRIDMAQYRFGRGEYQYFSYPLPPLVEELRHALYSRLEGVANRWAEMFESEHRFPGNLSELLARCHAAGQARPTPLVLRYGAGDYNCLHQDIYGAIAFPFQVVCFLNQPGTHYGGGEFLLTEQVPRAQTMGRVFQPDQGDAMVITTRHRPGQGRRGVYRINVKHGVSPVAWGQRHTLGIIFHDAE
jgi:hypothetical protein